MVAALQDALEAGRLVSGVMLPTSLLAIQVQAAHLLLLPTELVHPSLALLVPHHQDPCRDVHLGAV